MSGGEDVLLGQGDVSPSVASTALQLAQIKLLTDRESVAWVLREVEDVGRQEAADQLGIAPSTLDDRLGRARLKIGRAQETVGLVETLTDDQ